MNTAKALAALTVALALSSCSVLPETKEIALYQLPPPEFAASPAAVIPWSLRIKTPTASDALSGRRLLVMTDTNEFAVLANARWTAPIPQLWREHLLAALRSDGRLAGLSSDQDNLAAERELLGTLRAFHGDLHGDQPQVTIRYEATLADTNTRKILASHTFSLGQPVADDKPASLVAALGSGANQLAEEILNWLLTVGSNPGTKGEAE